MGAPPSDRPAVVAGEALVDVVVRTSQETLRRPGGSPLNVAVGLARLGHRTKLLASVGEDSDGALVRRHLERSGVELVAETCARTSSARVEHDASGNPGYAFDLCLSLPNVDVDAVLGPASWLHVGSLAALVEPAAFSVQALVDAVQGRCPISFDPNVRLQFPVDLGRVERLVEQADVVKLSIDDARLLVPGQPPESLARRWAGGGRRLVVLTRGVDGASAFLATAEPVEVQSAAARPLADTVGAGDAFMSALIHAQISGRTLDEALAFASLAGAVACTRTGADPPWASELVTRGSKEVRAARRQG